MASSEHFARSALLWFVGITAILALLCGGAYFAVNRIAQRVTYHPSSAVVEPALAGVEAVRIETADGETLVAWRRAAQPGAPTILFFDGNGGAPEAGGARWEEIGARGAGFLAVYYRGYSGSSGTPSEAGLAEDARAAYAYLRDSGVAAEDIVIHGFSLGSAVAVRLASEQPARALVLEAPMTSVLDIAAANAPRIVPMHLLLRDKFLSRERIGAVRMPVLIVHGDADEVIPFAMGEAMFARAPAPKSFVRVEGGRHADLVAHGLYDHVFAFLAADAAPD